MKNHKTRDNIIEQANKLFKQNGYESTGMRDIASACGISVSNVQYYFSKKVLIMAEVYDNMINAYFEDVLQEEQLRNLLGPSADSADAFMKITAVEYEFIIRALAGAGSADSYLSSLLLPEICNVYAEKSTELFMSRSLCPDKTKSQILLANTMMFGGLSQLLQFYLSHKNEYSLDEIMVYPFKSRLQLLDIDGADSIVAQALQYGNALASQPSRRDEFFK